MKQYNDSLMDKQAVERSEDVVGFFLDGSYVFDNFAPFQVEWRGKLWPTSEHAYQAAHFIDTHPKLAEKVRAAKSPREASDFANAHADKDRPDWKDVKLSVMEEICLCKLRQHAYIRQVLLDTGNRQLVEMSPHDAFWGWGPDKNGRNELGKVWMRLRDKLKAGQIKLSD